jgi:hypothetical protein
MSSGKVLPEYFSTHFIPDRRPSIKAQIKSISNPSLHYWPARTNTKHERWPRSAGLSCLSSF